VVVVVVVVAAAHTNKPTDRTKNEGSIDQPPYTIPRHICSSADSFRGRVLYNSFRPSRIQKPVSGVSAVAIHVDAVLGVGLVADRERPVLGRVPETRRLLLHFNPQSVRLPENGLLITERVERLKKERGKNRDKNKKKMMVFRRQRSRPTLLGGSTLRLFETE